ncbi:ATP-binding protein [Phenylobacterium sp. J426]|uniref:ATP-binding protein n=1 Tax=Phenylobacterium sp. J426 TaxID=2898439 RepID=UPI002151F6F0|nr:ATP-binding protein [Phenylobacterium sp. J426]MCR5876791.1 ATP-binding protein [Phenylobacterium sp. J426]
MLTHPTFDQLNVLGLQGMAKAFRELLDNPEAGGLGHADWLALLLDRETVHRQDKRLGARLRHARLRHHAVPEDIDYRAPRGLDRGVLTTLLKSHWIDAAENLVICGPTGVGKSWISCALGHKACRDNRSVLYVRVPKLFDELALAHGDGSIGRRFKSLGAVQLLILDDWGLEPLDAQARHDLLEIPRGPLRPALHHRHQPTTGLGLAHTVIGEATYADAILDRLVHNAHRLDLSGDSLRRPKPADQA